MQSRFLDSIPWSIVIIAVLTLGLAPFSPPHFFEKLSMLAGGTLHAPIDWFDLVFHGWTWLLLVAKAVSSIPFRREAPGSS